MATRLIRPAELALLRLLLSSKPEGERYLAELSQAQVTEMSDGGMGSLAFVGDADRRLGSVFAECSFKDADGVDVSAALNLDQNSELFELDIWKVDFSQLHWIPDVREIRLGFAGDAS